MNTDHELELRHVRSFVTESDRGCVILLGAHVDEFLKELHMTFIKSALPVRPNKLFDDLFGKYGPLSTFAARIQLGYAYGLVREGGYGDLERLRKLRNDAAHSHEDFTFDDCAVRQRVVGLQAPKRTLGSILALGITPEEKNAAEFPENNAQTTKLYFLLTGFSLIIEMQSTAIEILKGDFHKSRQVSANEQFSGIVERAVRSTE